MGDTAEIGENLVSKYRIQQADAGRESEPVSRDQGSGANEDRQGVLIYLVRLTTSRNSNLTRLILTMPKQRMRSTHDIQSRFVAFGRSVPVPSTHFARR